MASRWEVKPVDYSSLVVPPEVEHPDRLPEGFVLLDQWQNPDKPNDDDLFFQFGKLLVAFNGGPTKAYPNEYLTYQSVFPLGALSWVFWALDHFAMPESEGGLESGRVAVVRDVDGESLGFQRGVGPGNHLGGMYSLVNRSRAKYSKGPDPELYAVRQEFVFWDSFVSHGLLDVWRRLSERYEAGEFVESTVDAPLGWRHS